MRKKNGAVCSTRVYITVSWKCLNFECLLFLPFEMLTGAFVHRFPPPPPTRSLAQGSVALYRED